MATGEVEFRRPWGGAGGLARIKVHVDGIESLRLRPGETARLSVELGEHVVQARVANRASLPLTVVVEDGEEPLAIEIAPPGPWDNLRMGAYQDRKASLSCKLVGPPPPPSP